MNSSRLNLEQSRSKIIDLLLGIFKKMWGAKKSGGKWSDKVVLGFLRLFHKRYNSRKYYQ